MPVAVERSASPRPLAFQSHAQGCSPEAGDQRTGPNTTQMPVEPDQWLRVYMRSKTIKHNKDLFELVADGFALLEQLPLY
jgi:hypothetical protein